MTILPGRPSSLAVPGSHASLAVPSTPSLAVPGTHASLAVPGTGTAVSEPGPAVPAGPTLTESYRISKPIWEGLWHSEN